MENKTLIRWGAVVSIFLILGITFIWSSYNYNHFTIALTADEEGYNVTKVMMDTMKEINEKQGYYYTQYKTCRAVLEVNNITTDLLS